MNCFIPTSRSGKANGQNVIIFRNVCFTTIKFKLSLWKCRRTPEKPVMNRQTWHGWYKIFTIVYSLKYAVQKNKHYFTRYCSITVPKQKTLPAKSNFHTSSNQRRESVSFLCICRYLRDSKAKKICVMSRLLHVSERSLQRSEFDKTAHAFSRFFSP